MTSHSDAGMVSSRSGPATKISTDIGPWLALAALFVVAIVLRHLLAANTDVSWLLTAGERVLAGDRLYVNVIETNPPMAVLAYTPAIVIARALGVAAETVVDALVFAGIFASLGLCARILTRAGIVPRGQGWPLALLAFAVLAILPMQTFGQREHIAVIAMLPMLAVMACRIKDRAPSPHQLVLAGLGAAIALSFKPHFAIALYCGLAATAITTRSSLRILLNLEYLTVAALMALYVAVVAIAFPEFLTVIGPLVRDVYMPVRQPLTALVALPAMWLWLAAVVAVLVLKRRNGLDSSLFVLLAVSFGFAAGFTLQRKGWPYHSYPMLALALLVLGAALVSHQPERRADRMLGVGGVVLMAGLFARSMLWFDVAFDARPLQARVAQLGQHSAILAITAEPGIGHPLVRAVGGTWVSRQQALWVGTYLDVMRRRGSRDPALETYSERERAMLVADIRKTPPTVVLVDDLTGHGSTWLKAHPDVADLLKDFSTVDTINHIAILKRRD